MKRFFAFCFRLFAFPKGCGPWAEFAVEVFDTFIQVQGGVDGVPRQRIEEVALTDLKQSLEEHVLAGTLPPVLPSWEQDGHCTRRGQPWCGFYGVCFPADQTEEGQ